MPPALLCVLVLIFFAALGIQHQRHRRRTHALRRQNETLQRENDRLQQHRTHQHTQLETALGGLQEAVLILDATGSIHFANATFRAQLLPPAAPLHYQPIERILPPGPLLDYIHATRGNPAAPPPPQHEIQLPPSTPGATSYWVQITGAAIPPHGDPAAPDALPWTLYILHDITPHKRLETLRKEFVANVSHELRTPLSLIQGSTETLINLHENSGETNSLATDTLQFLHTIQRHSIRLNTLITDLLNLSRLEAPTPAFHPEPTSIASFIRDYFVEHMPAHPAPGHTVRNHIPAEVGVCNMDRPKLTQVLENLLTNARIHTPPGTQIEIHARRLRGNTPPCVEIEIRDNGPGIPPEDLPHIFERFYRVDKGRSRQNGGTGLGLSIVKHIIQLHGGVVRAESTPGRGSSFYFTLPLLRP